MTSPLTSTLDKVNAQSPYFKLHLGMPDAPGWQLANGIVCDEAWLVDHLSQMQVNLPHIPKHVVALNFFSGYAWYLATAGAACFLLDARAPDLAMENIAFKLDDQGWARGMALLGAGFACLPNDTAGLQGAQVLADRETLRRHLVTQVWDHLRRLIPNIRAFVPTSEHTLHNVLANALASTTLWMLQSMNLHNVVETESRAMAEALPFPARLRYFEVECNGERETHLDGAVCCYWYKRADNVKSEYCANCPKVPIAKRIEVLRSHMLARQQGDAAH